VRNLYHAHGGMYHHRVASQVIVDPVWCVPRHLWLVIHFIAHPEDSFISLQKICIVTTEQYEFLRVRRTTSTLLVPTSCYALRTSTITLILLEQMIIIYDVWARLWCQWTYQLAILTYINSYYLRFLLYCHNYYLVLA
jgi:hypothetical protein